MDDRLYSGIRPRNIWLVALSIEVAAVLFDYQYGNQHFARFGSLVVCWAILSASIGLFTLSNGAKLLPVWEASDLKFAQYIEDIATKNKQKLGPDNPITQEWIKEAREARDKAKSKSETRFEDVDRFRHILFLSEAGLLLLGTLQWGFGDLLINSECRTC